jgi:hypothetical protein
MLPMIPIEKHFEFPLYDFMASIRTHPKRDIGSVSISDLADTSDYPYGVYIEHRFYKSHHLACLVSWRHS